MTGNLFLSSSACAAHTRKETHMSRRLSNSASLCYKKLPYFANIPYTTYTEMGVNLSRSRAVAQDCSPDREDSRDAMKQESDSDEEFLEAHEEPRSPAEEMVEFKIELAMKREQRRKILAKHATERENLRKSLQSQVEVNETITNENNRLRELLEQNGIDVPQATAIQTEDSPLSVLMTDLENLKEHNRKLRRDLAATNLALQSANEDMTNLHGQNTECMKQISALKEVVAVSKTMMQIRESQLNELKSKLSQIETTLADREANLLSTDLRTEYERQLQNIRTLRTLYEERARLADVTRLQILRELEEQKELAAVETSRCKEVTDKVAELEAKVAEMSDAMDKKDEQISVTKEETRGLNAEMSTVNKLFSQMLLGYKSQQDLDKLVSRLEEHHGLLAHMVAREGAESCSALPKLLLELVGQIDQDKGVERQKEEDNNLNTTAEEIVGNLPKVWRVMMELLSHQSGAETAPGELHPTTCYKPVETSAGTRMVPSVSQTYIRLKDLIVEKLSLTKEMSKMKQLNVHLESRLEEQERRLCLVTSELSKTWHVVGRLRRHHHQLHTHEKILRYELQQKRKMLNELKEELEYCREKWDKAREKNIESENEWRKLRNEFSSRKSKANASINHSVESGYSDERQTEDDSTESTDDCEYLNDSPIRCKKRARKTFDTIPDSSTERNHVAERDDPISDSQDVADLPLDGLDADEKLEDMSTSEYCVSDHIEGNNSNDVIESKPSLLTSEGIDDFVNISDSSSGAADVSNIQQDCLKLQASNVSCIENHPKNMDNRDDYKETVPKNDERLSTLDVCTASLMEQTIKLTNLGNEIGKRLQNSYNRSEETGASRNSHDESSEKLTILCNTEGALTDDTTIDERGENIFSDNTSENINNQLNEPGPSKPIDPKEIIENINNQNERLAKRDNRMKRLEDGCTSLLQKSRNTLHVSANLESRLDVIHSDRNLPTNSVVIINQTGNNNEVVDTDVEIQNQPNNESITSNTVDDRLDMAEATTSTGSLDHEARFAARDERLKRLEEQAKSLVNKVNDTNNKSVRITYKLEELHNIYGSEGGTSTNMSPDESEDVEETGEQNIEPHDENGSN